MWKEKLILICEDTLEGICTAVYDGWRDAKTKEIEIRTYEPDGPELFSEQRRIQTDQTKAGRVLHTIRRQMGAAAYESICCAAASADGEKGTAVFYVLYQALGKGRCSRNIMEAVADPYVSKVLQLKTRVWREMHHYYGFLRFQEMGGAFLLAEMEPVNDILELLEPHFQNRFPKENWMIYDLKREKALVHPHGRDCFVMHRVKPEQMVDARPAASEQYEELWKAFCEAITIPERYNPELQKNLLPVYRRKYMTEFQ